MIKAWRTEKMPHDYEEGVICPIYKKGNELKCWMYTVYKTFSNVMYKRLLPHVEPILGNYQNGFRIGRTTADQMHAIRQILEKT
jgi:hypothetical protein